MVTMILFSTPACVLFCVYVFFFGEIPAKLKRELSTKYHTSIEYGALIQIEECGGAFIFSSFHTIESIVVVYAKSAALLPNTINYFKCISERIHCCLVEPSQICTVTVSRPLTPRHKSVSLPFWISFVCKQMICSMNR